MSEEMWLKSTINSRVFRYTPELAARGDMVPCNAQGEVKEGSFDASGVDVSSLRKTKYIGFMKEDGSYGRLFFWTEELAIKAGAIFIDDPSHWGGDASGVIVPGEEKQEAPKAVTKAAPLSRAKPDETASELVVDNTKPAETSEPVEEVPAETEETQEEPPESAEVSDAPLVEIVVPDISGLDAKKAKDKMVEWAEYNFNEKLDRRMNVTTMQARCDELVASLDAMPEAVGA